MKRWMELLTDPPRVIHGLDVLLQERDVERIKRGLNQEVERKRSVEFLSHVSGQPVAEFLQEYRASEFKKNYFERLGELRQRIGEARGATSDFDCETMYLTIRAFNPQIVVETGMLYGSFSAHILEALNQNQSGKLISLELVKEVLPGIPSGYLIAPHLRPRHEIVYGDCRTTLPEVCRRVGSIDLFNHDSIHSQEHMMWEYLTAHRFMKPGALITSHDVVPSRFCRNAFDVFASGQDYLHGVFLNFGIMQKK